MVWFRNKKNNFLVRTLIWGPVYGGFLSTIHISNIIAVYKGQNTCIVSVDVLQHRKQSFLQSNQDISWIKQGLSFKIFFHAQLN